MKHTDNIVFFSGTTNIRAGGPAGYIANLQKSLSETNCDNIVFITSNNTKFIAVKIIKFISSTISCICPIQSIRRRIRNTLIKILGFGATLDDIRTKTFYKHLLRYNPKTITCHYTPDALSIREFLTKYNLDAKLILMSHSPQPPSEEIYENALSKNDPTALDQLKHWQRLERSAFEAADIYLFPSPEALTCYTDKMEYLPNLIKQKQIVYMRTGCAELQTTKTTAQLRDEYNIKTPYVICYIGRHNTIKGYDKLKQIAAMVLQQRNDVTFLIGGALGPIEPLKHDRWLELGRCNPAEALKASDLFILPNKQTYFDLILLEVLSSGTPCIASKTGGNITVYQDTGAIQLYETITECADKINSFLDSGADTKTQMADMSRNAYLTHYTLQHFATNYINLIKEIIQ